MLPACWLVLKFGILAGKILMWACACCRCGSLRRTGAWVWQGGVNLLAVSKMAAVRAMLCACEMR
jgi:hypothetical protein